jgi:16S rRNA (cytosine1402-N4)-methyltransferase
MNFSGIDQIVAEAGLLNFVLADLGVSSMQIDNPERGFSFKMEGPLDLRLNPTTGKSAATLLKKITQPKLEEILIEHADEPNFKIIASTIINCIQKQIPIETTTQLKIIITKALENLPNQINKDEIKKTLQRCFQALRIEVNNEFGVLNQFLDKLPESLASGGKVAILTFHSGEDRRVKKSFQYLHREGIYSSISNEPIRANAEECFSNPRAKSAKLRWAIKA